MKKNFKSYFLKVCVNFFVCAVIMSFCIVCLLMLVLMMLFCNQLLFGVIGSGNTNLDNFEPAWFLLQNHHGTRYATTDYCCYYKSLSPAAIEVR